MQYKKFFEEPKLSSHKLYEALRSFIIEGKTASYVASKFGFTVNSVYSLVKDFKRLCKNDTPTNAFFLINKPGPKQLESDIQIKIRDLIVILRKKYLSIHDIKSVLDAQGMVVSEGYILKIIKNEVFARLHKRSMHAKEATKSQAKIEPPKSVSYDGRITTFKMSGIKTIISSISLLYRCFYHHF